ncbi:hypothetical protein APSETT445_003926 [Aspergillus pseudonomiae]
MLHQNPEEKPLSHVQDVEIDEEAEALEGYVVDPSQYPDNAARLKTSPDGRFVLIPQPLDTPNDPLNWSPRKKWFLVAIAAYIALLADYTGGTAIVTIIPQSIVGQGGALMWIKDLFFFHEHPKVINYVEFSIIMSPYIGPLITSFIVSGVSWRWAFWLCTIMSGVGLILILFLDESLFDRKHPPSSRGSYISRLTGVHQAKDWEHKSLIQCLALPVIAITKIPVLTILVYYFLNFAWVIGVNTTIGIWLTNIYGFSTRGIGYFYFFGIVGVLVGWFAGHFLHDAVGQYYTERHGGRLDPEARLIITYPATMICCVSLIILGLAFQYHWHYMVIAVFAATQCIGVMIVTTAINAYLLDSYPEGSGIVGAWVTASRNWAGFMATYIQIDWVTRIGPAKALGIQAAITFVSVFFMVFLQVYGKRLRKWQGRMRHTYATDIHPDLGMQRLKPALLSQFT